MELFYLVESIDHVQKYPAFIVCSILQVFILVVVGLTEVVLNLELGGLQNLLDVHSVDLLRVKGCMNTRVSIELALIVEQLVKEGPLWQLFDDEFMPCRRNWHSFIRQFDV